MATKSKSSDSKVHVGTQESMSERIKGQGSREKIVSADEE